MKPRLRGALFAAVLVVASLPAAATAGPEACDDRNNNTINKLLECVTVDGVREHQAAFQAIADASDGTRASGTPGYDGSVDYVAGVLEAAGYDVELNGFPFTYFPPGEIQQLAPVSVDYPTGSFSGTGFGDVTGNVIAVDLALGTADWPADPSTSPRTGRSST